ncbi:MAG TPA: reverse transcriptase/maturase family protein [Candidatus Paceibacterota bacterium]|nr:reverse transcriptase/maturase family protein [Candidatus Paceibacterota bacterium]HPP65021.1 reverse transcriptase/maturase family protein [Candidatus Paceibacterota bacterium]
MKTYKNLYNNIWDFQNLLKSYYAARKRKNDKDYVINCEWNLERELLEIKKEIQEKNYQPSVYQKFFVSDPKRRLVYVASFRDRIVHHALCNIIEPIFDKGFIFDSYACRKNKGTHRAVMRLKNFLRSLYFKCGSDNFYILKCDVRKFFDSVDKEILFALIKKKIKDKDVLWLIKKILDSTEGSKGIPIGNLTSQLFANIYLNELDQFVKHNLRIKYYARYMDDFVVLSNDKKQLKIWREFIKEFLANSLRLDLHPQKQEIFPARIGVDFLGFHIFYSHILIRKSMIRRFWKKFKKGRLDNKSFWSYLGHLEFADWWGFKKKIENKMPFVYNQSFCNFYGQRTANFS